MEAGLMEIVRYVNRCWIYDSYFSLYRPIYPGKCPGVENVRGDCQNTGQGCGGRSPLKLTTFSYFGD